jgi:hypothetical protein
MLELMPEEYGGLPAFRRDVLAHLRVAKGTPRELRLATFMVELLTAPLNGPEVKPATP